MEEEYKTASIVVKRPSQGRNEELELQEQYIEQKNKELRNELQELKKSIAGMDKSGVGSSKVYSLNEERYKVMEEELKLKISTLREELDHKQLEFKSAIHEKQVEVATLKDQLHTSISQKSSL